MFRRLLTLTLAAAALVGMSLYWLQTMNGPRGELEKATVLPESMPLPEFELTGQDGQPFSKDRFRGKFSLVFFGFTHCPDICPATLQLLALARSRMAKSGAALPDIVLISVDPERDTPELLAKYTAYFGDGVSGVTGDLDELKKLASALGIFFEKSAGEDYNVAHSAVVLVINADAELQALFSAPQDVNAIVNDLPLLMASG